MFSKKGTTTVFTKPLRPGLVGKRFIMMREEDIHVKDSQKYRWKKGCIRACSVKDVYDPELQVLIEYDGISWEYRQWIKIYEQTKAFYVESNIVWAPRVLPGNNAQNINWWPALAFVSLIDFITADVECKIPIEYFGDKLLVFLHEKKIGLFKEDEECSRKVSCLYPNVQDDIKQWQMLQKTQSCLMMGAETLTGVRVIVYRLELRQWYTGCITAHNLSTGELHVMDDNVLQTHPVDPALVQIKLMACEEELNRLLVGEQSKSRRHRHLPSHLLSNSNEQKSQGKCVSVKKSQFEENGIDKKITKNPRHQSSSNDKSLISRKENDASETNTVKVHKLMPITTTSSDNINYPPYSTQSPKIIASPYLACRRNNNSPNMTLSIHTNTPPSRNKMSSRPASYQSPIASMPLSGQSVWAAVGHESRENKHEVGSSDYSRWHGEGIFSLSGVSMSSPETLLSQKINVKNNANVCQATTDNKTIQSSTASLQGFGQPRDLSHRSDDLFHSLRGNCSLEGELENSASSRANSCNDKKMSDSMNGKHMATILHKKSSNISSLEVQQTNGNVHIPQEVMVDNDFKQNIRINMRQSNNTLTDKIPSCSHLRSIAKIQFDYLMYLEALVRFQHRTIVEAVDIISKTATEEQGFLVTDFFTKLVESNWHTERIFHEAFFTRQEKQRAQYDRHASFKTCTSESFNGCLPEDMRKRLRSMQDAVNKERDEVLNVVLSCDESRHGKDRKDWEMLKQQMMAEQWEKHTKQNNNLGFLSFPPYNDKDLWKKMKDLSDAPRTYEHFHNDDQGPTLNDHIQSLSGSVTQMSNGNCKNQQPLQHKLLQQQQQKRQQQQQPLQKLQQLQQQLQQQQQQQQQQRQQQPQQPQQQQQQQQQPQQQKQQQQQQEYQLQQEHFEQKKQQHENVEKTMVDKLLQIEDVQQKALFLQHIVQELESQKGTKDSLNSLSDVQKAAKESQTSNTYREKKLAQTFQMNSNHVLSNSPMSFQTSAEQLLSCVASIVPLKETNIEIDQGLKTASTMRLNEKTTLSQVTKRKNERMASLAVKRSRKKNVNMKNLHPEKSLKTNTNMTATCDTKNVEQNRLKMLAWAASSTLRNDYSTQTSQTPVFTNVIKFSPPKNPNENRRQSVDSDRQSSVDCTNSLTNKQHSVKTVQDSSFFTGVSTSTVSPKLSVVSIGTFSPHAQKIEKNAPLEQSSSFSGKVDDKFDEALRQMDKVDLVKGVNCSQQRFTTTKISKKSNGKITKNFQLSKKNPLALLCLLTEKKRENESKKQDADWMETDVTSNFRKNRNTEVTEDSSNKALESKNADQIKQKVGSGLRGSAVRNENVLSACLQNVDLPQSSEQHLRNCEISSTEEHLTATKTTKAKQSSGTRKKISRNKENNKTVCSSENKDKDNESELKQKNLVSRKDIWATAHSKNRISSIVTDNKTSKVKEKRENSVANDMIGKNIDFTAKLCLWDFDRDSVINNVLTAKKETEMILWKTQNGRILDGDDSENLESPSENLNKNYVNKLNDKNLETSIVDNINGRAMIAASVDDSHTLTAEERLMSTSLNYGKQCEMDVKELHHKFNDDLENIRLKRQDGKGISEEECFVRRQEFDSNKMIKDCVNSRKRKRFQNASETSKTDLEKDGEDCLSISTDDAEKDQHPEKKLVKKNSEENKTTKCRKKKEKTSKESNDGDTLIAKMDTSDEKTGNKESVNEAKRIAKERKCREKVKEDWVYFLQRGGCKAFPSLPQCRECNNFEHHDETICCRFDLFRQCRSKSNKFETAGFLTSEHAQTEDFVPWIAGNEVNTLLSFEVSKYILANVGDEFCNLVQQEEKAFFLQNSKGSQKVAWKRAVRGTREMCDACATTIFNVHWVCPKCGFGVCLDCYAERMNVSLSADSGRSKRFLWMKCSTNVSHRPQRLLLAHIIPKNTLHKISEQLHAAREYWGIGETCPCKQYKNTAEVKEIADNSSVDECLPISTRLEEKTDGFVDTENASATPNVVGKNNDTLKKSNVEKLEDTVTDDTQMVETSKLHANKSLNPLVNETSTTSENVLISSGSNHLSETSQFPNVPSATSQDTVVSPVVPEDGKTPDVISQNEDEEIEKLSFGALSLIMDYDSPPSSPNTLQMNVITPAEEALITRPSSTEGQSSEMDIQHSKAAFTSLENTSVFMKKSIEPCYQSSNMESLETVDLTTRVQPRITDELPAPHSWICQRPMLRLHVPDHEGNLKAFQSRWVKGEPILVSGVHTKMESHLWTPEGFELEFGSEKADVVNCKTGGTIEKMEIGTFWKGFESVQDRPLDYKGQPTLLKLKDWPPEADFVEKMPRRFNDLMSALPLQEYTSREGTRNLVSRLPDFFAKPDLGPKMYNAYGNAAFPSAGTTNLHIDMSDAVNVMVYVGVPHEKVYGEQERKDSMTCLDKACDETQQYRAHKETEALGALWHIFAAADANKIREFFHKVCREKNMKYPASHDPIHDQCFYLDEPLLKRLKDEYGVVGWPIAQFLGDAIFIPAGAPHQVRNLHSCVKAAEDFVSPEHVGHCFKLTEEFRHLSDKHTNHEDKLQVKNIIYHAVKDAVSVLRYHELSLKDMKTTQSK